MLSWAEYVTSVFSLLVTLKRAFFVQTTTKLISASDTKVNLTGSTLATAPLSYNYRLAVRTNWPLC